MKKTVVLAKNLRKFNDYFLRGIVMEGYEIIFADNAEDAVSALSASDIKPVALITGMKLPPGELFSNDPDILNETRTGLILYQYMRERDEQLPIIILSSCSDALVEMESLLNTDPFLGLVYEAGSQPIKYLVKNLNVLVGKSVLVS